ncbi:transposase [Mesorhizobium opportunistum]|uniref:transposase n=1 Tax=Mesorhizobium opportunistum TaxID=593909 RepID=UPI003338C7A9
MDVHLDVPTAGYAGRLEILEGPTGRRVRSEADRARIAAESLMPGVQVAVVARKHGATRWQIYDWRRLRRGQLALPESVAPMFAPLMVEEPSAPQRTMRPPKPAPAKVEIVIDRTAVDLEHLAQVIRAVRASR